MIRAYLKRVTLSIAILRLLSEVRLNVVNWVKMFNSWE